MSEFSARSTRVMTSPQAAEQSVTLTPRPVYLKWAFGSSCGTEIFGSEVILLLNKASGFRTRTDDSEPGTCQIWSFCMAYYETIERPAGCPDQNQRWWSGDLHLLHSLLTLCCTVVGVWSTTVHTNSYWNCPVTGNQKNMSKAVCLESTAFLSFSSAPSEYLSLFFHWAHGSTSARTFSPRSFQTMKKIALVNHSFNSLFFVIMF